MLSLLITLFEPLQIGNGTHRMDNEMHPWLKELQNVVQCSRFFLLKNQGYPRVLEARESRIMLSSQITDELKLGMPPVG